MSPKTKASAPTRTVESLARTAAGVRTRRHDHRRQRVADLRRRVRGAGHVASQCRTAWMADPRRDRRARRGRRPRQFPAFAAFARHCARARARAARRRPTSTCSRSTKRSRRSRSSRCASSTSTPSVVNVNGGAIALGHPIGMSGARLALHLSTNFAGAAAASASPGLCGGGGQGDALVLRVASA